MSCIAALGLYIANCYSYEDLTPVGIIPCDRERSVPATPIVLCSSRSMIVNQISFVIVVLTNDVSLGP
eukprot:6304779-Pyramimonas_sp.AAC.1